MCKCLHPFPHSQNNHVWVIVEQSGRLSITEAPIGLYTSRIFFGPFLHIEFQQNMVALNMHFKKQM